MGSDQIFEKLKAAITESSDRTRNEADTRHKVIDLVLHDVLAWPKNRTSVEEYIKPGYADYVLRQSNDSPILLIEAKREGIYFNIPPAYKPKEDWTYISLEKLMTDPAIDAAIRQVRNYCVEIGCEYAGITNGHEWIFFKTFERAQNWSSMRAFVVRRLSFFLNGYTFAVGALSYTSITDRASLPGLLTSAPPKDRTIFYPRDRVTSFTTGVDSNRLAPLLRPVVNRYFRNISDEDPEFMRRCYVSQKDDKDSRRSIHSLIQDTLTPYFSEYGVRQLTTTDDGGQLGEKVTKAVKRLNKSEVLILFGGKGAGKSTFLRRLLHHEPPKWLREHSTNAIVDLLNVPADIDSIRRFIWHELVSLLDVDNLLTGNRDEVVSDIFRDRFDIAVRQDLAGLESTSEAYNIRLNAMVADWKADKAYCAARLCRYWNRKGRGVIVVLDNTDQYPGEIQDYCFTSAQEISSQLGCVSLISMREERFYNSKMHGVLDAFQNSGFHISSPEPAEVFRKRVEYVEEVVSKPSEEHVLLEDDEEIKEEIVRYLAVVREELKKRNSHLTSFLTACAHGDTRLSLDLFRSFLLSGYTNVDEIIGARTWDFQIHQVIKPVMIPTRFFYDETISDIPNVFQLRNSRHCSHFTSLRILRKLAKAVDSGTAGYVPLAQLHAYFAETFNMSDDMQANMDVLLKRGFVEARNRLDEFSDGVDAVKITPYGTYMLNDLAFYFAYIDLICVDTGVFDEETSSYLAQAASKEYELFLRRERIPRIELRLDRAEKFIDYLSAEERRERESYSLAMPEAEMFTYKAREVFATEKKRVLISANRRRR